MGLVDEVITEIDPDYHWSDRFRTSRSSNEASQRILNQMSCRLRRQMGCKAVEMGGNAILAYTQWIDIEPYSQTITLRGLGTAAILEALPTTTSDPSSNSSSDSSSSRASSDPGPTGRPQDPPSVLLYSRGIELATLNKLPSACIVAMGGVVSAKSVKVLSEESEYGSAATRDRWLSELREEIKSHARSLGCNIVLGYSESISIHDALYVLAAEGTACRLGRKESSRRTHPSLRSVSSGDEEEEEKALGAREEAKDDHSLTVRPSRQKHRHRIKKPRECAACHLPKKRLATSPLESLERCNICRRAFVSKLVLSTVELPSDLECFGGTQIIESYVCRPLKRKRDGEHLAVTVSSNLPFVEYDAYRQMQFKMRSNGYNAVFSLRYQLLVSDQVIIAIVAGTGVCVAALPRPQALQINRNIGIKDAEDAEIYDFQQRVALASAERHALVESRYSLRFPQQTSSSSGDDDSTSSSSSSAGSSSSSGESSASSEDEIVQIDDEADEDLLLTLMEPLCTLVGLLSSMDSQPIEDPAVSSPLKSSLQLSSHFVCNFRRFSIDLLDHQLHHPNSFLAQHFSAQYVEIMEQVAGVFSSISQPQLHCVRHQLNLVRSVELQIVTTATIYGYMPCPTTSPPAAALVDIPSPIKFRPEDAIEETLLPEAPMVIFTTGTAIPRSHFSANCGTITLQLFKEIYYHESIGGFPGFVHSIMADLMAYARASARALGGNALCSVAFKPAAFYENFKSQLHAVVSLTADVVTVERQHDEAI